MTALAQFDCPRCQKGKLYPLISSDLSAYEADCCPACGGTWFFDPPLPASPELIKAFLSNWEERM